MPAFAPRERREIDDTRAASALGREGKMREGGTSHSSHAAKIERHRLRPKLVVGRRERSPPDERTGVVDQNAEAAEKTHRLSHDSLDLFGRIEVASPRGTAPSKHAGF